LHKQKLTAEVTVMKSVAKDLIGRTIMQNPIKTMKLLMKRYLHPLGIWFAFL